jgi:hypothetical protein
LEELNTKVTWIENGWVIKSEFSSKWPAIGWSNPIEILKEYIKSGFSSEEGICGLKYIKPLPEDKEMILATKVASHFSEDQIKSNLLHKL